MAKKKKKKPKLRYAPSPNGNPKGSGRKPKPIDWDIVRNLCEAHCTQAEVAAKMNLNITTLKQRCIQEHGIDFTTFYKEGIKTGNASIRAIQYAKAMDGDNTMLLWLGKNRLGQTDRQEVEVKVKPFILEDPNGGKAMELGVQPVEELDGEVIDVEAIEQSEATRYDAESDTTEGIEDVNSKDEQDRPG